MSILEDESCFFAQVDSVGVKEQHPYVPGDIERVNELEAQRLGVSFFTIFDKSEKPYPFQVLIGIALPLNEELTRHIVLLISGEKIIIEPKNEGSIELYKRMLSGDQSYIFEEATGMGQIAEDAFNSASLGSRVDLRNDTPGNVEFMDGLVIGAINVAKEVRDKDQVLGSRAA